MENPTYPPACGRAREIAPPGHQAAAAATRYTAPAAAREPDSVLGGLLPGEAATRAAARGATQAAPVRISGWYECDAAEVRAHGPGSAAAIPEPTRGPSADRATSERGLRGVGRDSGLDQLGLPALERRRDRDANGESVHFELEYCLHVPRRSAPACAENSAATMPIVIPLTAYPLTAYP